jgi:hypothetical protein
MFSAGVDLLLLFRSRETYFSLSRMRERVGLRVLAAHRR